MSAAAQSLPRQMPAVDGGAPPLPVTTERIRPRFFPDELRNKPTVSVHAAEAPWARARPASAADALAEIAGKVFTDKDRKEIQRLENAIGQVDADRKKYCDVKRIDEALWELSQQLTLAPEEFAEKSREIEQQRADIPRWTLALDRKDAEIKEAMRPFALRLAVELPGRIAKAINGQEKAAGPDGVMAYWGIAQNFDASVVVHPLRRLHELALGWLASLQKNDAEAKESLIRALLADSGALQPKVFVFRR